MMEIKGLTFIDLLPMMNSGRTGQNESDKHLELSTGPDLSSSSQHESTNYRLPLLLPNKQTTASVVIL